MSLCESQTFAVLYSAYYQVRKTSVKSSIFILGDFCPSHSVYFSSYHEIAVPQVYTTTLAEGIKFFCYCYSYSYCYLLYWPHQIEFSC